MVQNLLVKLMITQLAKKFPALIKPGGSSPPPLPLQMTAKQSYPQPDEFISQFHTPFLKDPFYYFPLIYA
jgi:hypothetical protein